MRLWRAQKSQSLVEFALVLPIVLLIIIGLIETGRLLFIYASVITSARQAVRYAIATGTTGTNDAGIPHYQDCAGIRNEARRTAFINTLDDNQINIAYDNPDKNKGATPYCSCETTCPDIDTSYTADSGDRILVTVTTEFVPLTPGLLPYRNFNITASAARTVLGSVSVGPPSP